jgi:hypothetical protein
MTRSEDSHLAHTVNVSNRGVKFGGCQGEFKVATRSKFFAEP